MRSSGPKGRWPSDVQQCGEAADQGRQAAGPSEQRAAKRSADERSEAEAPNPTTTYNEPPTASPRTAVVPNRLGFFPRVVVGLGLG